MNTAKEVCLGVGSRKKVKDKSWRTLPKPILALKDIAPQRCCGPVRTCETIFTNEKLLVGVFEKNHYTGLLEVTLSFMEGIQ